MPSPTKPLSFLLLTTSLIVLSSTSTSSFALAQPHDNHHQGGAGGHAVRKGHAHIAHNHEGKEKGRQAEGSETIGQVINTDMHIEQIDILKFDQPQHQLPTDLPIPIPFHFLERRAGAPAATDTAGQSIFNSELQSFYTTTSADGSVHTLTTGAGGAGSVTPTTGTSVSSKSASATPTSTSSVPVVTSSVTQSPSTTSTTSDPPITSSSTLIPTTSSTSTTIAPSTQVITSQTTLPPTTIAHSTTSSLITSSIALIKTPSHSTTASTSSSTASAAAAGSGSSSSTGGINKTTMIALIVAGAAVVGIAVGWTLFRKYKLKPSKRFDSRLQPLNFSPSNDIPDPFLEKSRRYGGTNRHSATSMTSISSADRQRRQMVNELDMEQEKGSGGGVYDDSQPMQQMRYGAMSYPPLMNDLPGHDFTAGGGGAGVAASGGAGYGAGVGYPQHHEPNDGYADLRRAPSTAGTNFAGMGAGSRGLPSSGADAGGYYSDHGHGGGGQGGMEVMNNGGYDDHYGGAQQHQQQQYLDENFSVPEMGGGAYGRPTAGAGPYAAATHFAGSGARY